MPTKSNVANLAGAGILKPWDILDFEWRVIPKQDLRSVLYSSPPCINELLSKLLKLQYTTS
jgi:hypothetical protein